MNRKSGNSKLEIQNVHCIKPFLMQDVFHVSCLFRIRKYGPEKNPYSESTINKLTIKVLIKGTRTKEIICSNSIECIPDMCPEMLFSSFLNLDKVHIFF